MGTPATSGPVADGRDGGPAEPAAEGAARDSGEAPRRTPSPPSGSGANAGTLVCSRALAADTDRDGRIAVRGSDDDLTYRNLRERAARVAQASASWNARVATGPPAVAVLGDWTAGFAAVFLGLASAGWAVGVLDPSWTGDELGAAVAQLDPCAVVVADDCTAGAAELARADWSPAAPLEPGWTVLTSAGIGGSAPPPAPAPDSAFYVGFTSGSAGRPKAFVRSHRSWWESFETFGGLCSRRPGDPVLVPGPLSSSHFLFGALHGLHAGATVELVASADYSPEALARRLDGRDAVAGLFVVPTMLARLAEGESAPGAVGDIFCAGARLDADVRRRAEARFPGCRIVEYYGASELSFVAVQMPGDGSPPGSVGRVFPGVEVTIRDDRDRVVPLGEQGVVFARSSLVFTGYRGAPPESGARRIEDGWLTVGDRGSLDADGCLTVVGRGSHLIITGGANVQPEEVEEVVASCPGVAGCVVVGVPDPGWGEIVCAVVVPKDGLLPLRADLRREVARLLSRHKRPRRYVTLDRPPPLGRGGKVDRHRVRELVLDGRSARELR